MHAWALVQFLLHIAHGNLSLFGGLSSFPDKIEAAIRSILLSSLYLNALAILVDYWGDRRVDGNKQLSDLQTINKRQFHFCKEKNNLIIKRIE